MKLRGQSGRSLATINPLTGVATLIGDTAFNPVDGLLCHASGHTGDCDRLNDDGVCFETVNLGTLAITDIDITGSALTGEETQALTWWANQGVFLWKQNHGSGPLFSVTPAGVPTLIGQLDHQSKGLAFADAPAVPEPATVSLIGLGIRALLLVQRKRRRA